MKKKRALVIVLLLSVSAVILLAAVFPSIGAGRMNLNKYVVQWDGQERTFYAFNEKAFAGKKPVPVLFVLHGGGGTADKLSRVMKYSYEKHAQKDGFVVIYPQGQNNYWNDGREISQTKHSGADDVGFLNSLINYAIKNFNADPKRVYFTGLSNGGFMTTRMAIEKSDRIAAIAPVISTMSVEASKLPKPSSPISVLMINGTEDPLVPYNGGDIKIFRRTRGKCISTDKTMEYWVKHNGCKTTPKTFSLPDSNTGDGITTEVFTWSGGKNNSEVVLYKVIGGGHTLPGGVQYLPERIIGKTCGDFNACEVIWNFLKTKSR
jgi:polyhydroxybutyrate depolymerase